MNSGNQELYNDSSGKPQLSIVVPAYNEQENLSKLYEELVKVLSLLNMSWEIIISDDGSEDNTWEEIQSLHKADNRIKGIRLSRNFGHQYALFAGLSYAMGEAVISMDADLQHPPKIIPKLVAEWQRGNKIVHTIRLDAGDIPLFKKFASRLFYKVFSLLSGVNIESGMADFRLLDSQVVDSILEFREGGLFLRGIVQWVGYPSSKVEFKSHNRFSGISKYTFKKKMKLALSGITSFSIVPLRVVIVIGLLTSMIAFGELIYAIYSKLITGHVVPGWASAVSIVSFLFGILFILLGLIGEYIGRILIEVRSRPHFIISQQVGIRSPVKDRPIG